MTDQTPPQPQSLDAEALKARKRRNLWLGLALFGFVILVGVTTVIRLGDSDLGPDGGFYWRNGTGSETAPMPELPGDADADNSGEGDGS